MRPDPLDPTIPPVAAVCLYPQLVPVALEHLDGTGVKVASVAGGFPSGLGPLDARLQEIRDVAEAGAHEIDIVLNRSCSSAELRAGLRGARGRSRGRRLGPPEGDPRDRRARSYDRVRQASMLAMAAGADFIKTSTGKIAVNATLPVALCMMEAIGDFHRTRGAPWDQGGGRGPQPSRRSSTWSCSTRPSGRRG